MLTFFLLLVCIVATVVSDIFGEPPSYLVGLLGTAAGAFFAAIGSDKQKRDTDVAETAHRAEEKADRAERAVEATDLRATEAETRESGWSRHRDHHTPHEEER